MRICPLKPEPLPNPVKQPLHVCVVCGQVSSSHGGVPPQCAQRQADAVRIVQCNTENSLIGRRFSSVCRRLGRGTKCARDAKCSCTSAGNRAMANIGFAELAGQRGLLQVHAARTDRIRFLEMRP
jgi:hypothetical protein